MECLIDESIKAGGEYSGDSFRSTAIFMNFCGGRREPRNGAGRRSASQFKSAHAALFEGTEVRLCFTL